MIIINTNININIRMNEDQKKQIDVFFADI